MSEVKERKGGRTAKHDPGFVRSISHQVMVAYFNDHQDELREKIKKSGAGYMANLWNIAVHKDKFTREVLDAIEASDVPTLEEITFNVYRIGLLVETRVLSMPEERQRAYSRAYLDLVADVLAARERVLHGRPVGLTVPDAEDEGEAEDEDYGL